MASLWSRFVAAFRAFREPVVVTDILDHEEFGDFASRKLRYALLWAFYENTAYRDIHSWAKKYKADHGLYRHIRSIYNPAYRLVEFHKTHLMGGYLDPVAGDGEIEPTAIPVLTENEALRAAIAKLWQWSNWHINKDVMTLYGAVFGDVGIRVVDDTDRGKVYLEVVHPRIIKDVSLDRWRNVKGYTLEELRDDPRGGKKKVTYTEEADRDGDNVVYRTLLDGKPYTWNGVAAEWEEPYGFIPFVLVAHNDVGMTWGWSELHPIRSKVHEADDLTSMLDDQIRKTVNPFWLFKGVEAPTKNGDTVEASSPSGTSSKSAPGREEMAALYGDVDAGAEALVAPLDIPGTSAHIMTILEEIERDFPELQADIWTSSGDTSGRALRIARQRVESKIRQRRMNYDYGLEKAQQMAVAIGGWRRYDGFDGFDLGSYESGDLDHSIGKRSVFSQDPFDDIELKRAFWEVAATAAAAGLPIDEYLREGGWDEEDIDRVLDAQERDRASQAEYDMTQRQHENAGALAVLGQALKGKKNGAESDR